MFESNSDCINKITGVNLTENNLDLTGNGLIDVVIREYTDKFTPAYIKVTVTNNKDIKEVYFGRFTIEG